MHTEMNHNTHGNIIGYIKTVFPYWCLLSFKDDLNIFILLTF